MALDQQEEVREHLEEVDDQQGTNLDEKRMQVSTPPHTTTHLRTNPQANDPY